MYEDKKILVVDDEIDIRELLVDILTEDGFQVETACNGRAALELLQSPRGFVVLITDIMMPEMNGIELVREARKVAPSVIPIVMTAFATLDTARAAVKEGAYDYVLKPFSLSEVKLAVTNAIERHRLEQDNARLREITGLFNISESIAAIRDERQLLDFVLSAALERVGAERGSLMIMTPDARALEVAVSVGIDPGDAKTIVEVGSGISGWVAQHGRPLLVGNILDDPSVTEMSRRLQDPSFVSVPLERKLLAGHEAAAGIDLPNILGVLNVNKKKDAGQFTESDLKVLSIIANHAAAALENVRLIKSVEDAHLATLQSMALLLEAKDAYTHGHSERVRSYSLMAARAMGLSEQDVEILRVAAPLHDLGKVGVKDNVLNKNGAPTSEEWEMIKRHPILGCDVLAPVRLLTREHLNLVRGHHERMDGTGYPDGLQGDQIPTATRVIIVADAYDAMASDRAYRPALSPDKIIEQLRRFSSSQFDPKVANVFIDMIEKGEIPQNPGAS